VTWPNVTVGRMTLRETFDADVNIHTGTDKRTLGLKGEESYPPLGTLAELQARQEDILGLLDRFVPIVFGSKSDHNGYYLIKDINTSIINWTGEVAKFSWGIQAEYVGPANAVDAESRLAYVVRQNDFGLTGERWHAPAGAAVGYFTGSNLPSANVDRPSIDGGPITVYRGTPTAVSPRWSSPLTTYGRGRARVIVSGLERTAVNITVSASAWEINNGLVSCSAAPTATLQYGLWDGATWDTKLWNVSAAGSATDLGAFDSAAVVRNDYEAVTVRLFKAKSPGPGRHQLDLTMRRGSHIVEGYLQTDTSATLAVYLENAEAGTAPASAGYVTATANDGAGNRYIVGSARTFTALTAQGGIQKSSATSLDFFIGSVLAGGSASASNDATRLRDQFIVVAAEQSIGVRR
jgi:hypothetical protein